MAKYTGILVVVSLSCEAMMRVPRLQGVEALSLRASRSRRMSVIFYLWSFCRLIVPVGRGMKLDRLPVSLVIGMHGASLDIFLTLVLMCA